MAPSHGPPARVLSPLSLWLQSLSCYLSLVAKRSTPKPRGPLYSPSEPCGPFPHFRTAWFSLFLLQNHMALFLFPQNLMVPLFTPEPCGPLFTSEPHGLLLSHPKPCGPPPSMAAAPRFKSQHPSSFAAPFPNPPTVSYTWLQGLRESVEMIGSRPWGHTCPDLLWQPSKAGRIRGCWQA